MFFVVQSYYKLQTEQNYSIMGTAECSTLQYEISVLSKDSHEIQKQFPGISVSPDLRKDENISAD